MLVVDPHRDLPVLSPREPMDFAPLQRHAANGGPEAGRRHRVGMLSRLGMLGALQTPASRPNPISFTGERTSRFASRTLSPKLRAD